MRRNLFTCCCLFLYLHLTPYAHASTANLVESGVTQTFKSEIFFKNVSDDGTVLVITENGVIQYLTPYLQEFSIPYGHLNQM